MRYKIYHARPSIIRQSLFFNQSGFIYGVEQLKREVSNNNYEFVSLIEARDEEDAYFLTQNLDKSWSGGKHRSTSVGDIIVDEEHNAYAVASVGFVLVGQAKFLNNNHLKEIL